MTEKEQKIPDKLPDGFDREVYEQAKPHFIAAYQATIRVGQSAKDFVRLVIRAFGIKIKPYLLHFMKEVRDGAINPEEKPYGLEGKTEVPGGRVPEVELGEKPKMSPDSHKDDAKLDTTGYKKGDFIGQKYEVYDVIGEGGFGIVYLVYSHETKSAYALKTFKHEYLDNKQTRDRFRKEAQVWIDLERHPYLVRAYFVDEISGRLYIAMEYVAPDEQDLNTLDAYLRKRPSGLAQTLRWAIQFCHGMEHAYSKGIKAHRDIKPANIMIDQNKTVKISDFGLAGVISTTKSFSDIKLSVSRNFSGETYQTIEGTAFGTPPYMSPEQFENAAGCDERSDIYSFGIVLYQMASGGNLPFDPNMTGSKADNVLQDWYILHCNAPIPKLKSPLSTIIQKCLEKEQRKRYQTFKVLRSDLEILLRRETGEVIKLPEQKEEFDVFEWNAKGLSLDRLGKSEEAIYCYEQAIKLDSQNVIIWNNKGLALDHLRRFEEALACCNKALSIDSLCSSAWNTKGNCFEHLKRYNEAIECYKKAVELDSGFVEPWYNIGNNLLFLGRAEDAILSYDKALKINSSYSPAWTNKGSALLRLSKYKEALLCLDKALSINPLSIYAWINKGDCLMSLKQFHIAINCFNRVLDIDNENIHALRNKIICFMEMGQLHDALIFSKMALLIIPQEPSLLFIKAGIEDNVGNSNDAAMSYQQFLNVAKPEVMSEQIKMARGRLHFLLE